MFLHLSFKINQFIQQQSKQHKIDSSNFVMILIRSTEQHIICGCARPLNIGMRIISRGIKLQAHNVIVLLFSVGPQTMARQQWKSQKQPLPQSRNRVKYSFAVIEQAGRHCSYVMYIAYTFIIIYRYLLSAIIIIII